MCNFAGDEYLNFGLLNIAVFIIYDLFVHVIIILTAPTGIDISSLMTC